MDCEHCNSEMEREECFDGNNPEPNSDISFTCINDDCSFFIDQGEQFYIIETKEDRDDQAADDAYDAAKDDGLI